MLNKIHKIPVIRHFTIRPRLLMVMVFGGLLAFLLPPDMREVTRVLVAWDSAIALYLVLVAIMMSRSDMHKMQQRAAMEDEGGKLILGLTIITAVASLVAIIAELASAKGLTGSAQLEHIGLASLTVFLSWSFMQTMFALHYAHEYYNSCADGGPKALEFPRHSATPDYWDFVYFSFIIGTAAQTADINIVAKNIRRIVTLHCVVVFFFNTTVLALTVNIGASLF